MRTFTKFYSALLIVTCISSNAYSMTLKDLDENYWDETGTIKTLAVQINANPSKNNIQSALEICPEVRSGLRIPDSSEREELLEELRAHAKENEKFHTILEAMLAYYEGREEEDQFNMIRLLFAIDVRLFRLSSREESSTCESSEGRQSSSRNSSLKKPSSF